ncbi:hypothetical protein G6F35_017900 [Rhizopus arrhizus]|nr:hypothetical protein G6F24_016991 [Rhizopus arrhizus]KAG1166949.1 hypothetical protein G6F35_017900 [Rhizopus arrhizus]
MGRQRRITGGFEAGNQSGPSRFDQHIAQARAYQRRVAAMAATEHQREVRALCHELAQRIAALQGLAGTARFQHRVRMHQQAVPAGRHRDRQQAIGGAQCQSPQ